jgi:hypothetical protein
MMNNRNGRVALGGYPPKAPTDPYVRALAHTVLPFTVSRHRQSRALSDALDARWGGRCYPTLFR